MHDSPARKDVFVKINQSEKFALRFCPTRWTENEDVAPRAIQVWDHYNALMQHFSTLCASKQPKNNSSYDTLKEHRHDKLMKLKFQAFRDVAHNMNLFLTVFQTDAPMIPFLSDTLESLMRRIMGYVVRGTVLDEAAIPYQLMKIDVSFDSKSLLLVKDVKLPTATKAMLKQITPIPG